MATYLTEEISGEEFSVYGIPNAPYDTEEKKVGASSISFNGVDQYIAKSGLGVLLNSSTWTVSFWIYRISTGRQCWFENRDGGGTNWAMYKSGDYFRFNFYGWTGIALPIGYVPTGTWTHVAVVRNGTNWKCFANGTQRVNLNASHSAGSTDRTIRIGYGYDETEWPYFEGRFDEFWITNTAEYTTNFTPPTNKITNPGSEYQFLMHFDQPTYKISGTTTEECRVIVYNESTWGEEANETVSAGAYNISVSDGVKTVIGVPITSSGSNGVVYRGVNAALV